MRFLDSEVRGGEGFSELFSLFFWFWVRAGCFCSVGFRFFLGGKVGFGLRGCSRFWEAVGGG